MGPRARALAALAVLAAALAAGLPPAALGQLPGGAQVADLSVVAVALNPAVPRVDQETNATAVVRNDGPNNAASFEVHFEWNGTEALADGSSFTWPQDRDHFTNARNETGEPDDDPVEGCLTQVSGLRRGCSVTAFFLWTPPASRAGEGNVTPRAQVGGAASDPAPANDNATLPVFVRLHKLNLTLDNRDTLSKEVRPGNAAFYRLTVRNEGNGEDTIRLNLSATTWAATSGVVANGSAAAPLERVVNITLPMGASTEALAVMKAPATGTAAGTGTVQVNVTAAPALGARSLDLPSTASKATASASYAFSPLPPEEGLVAGGLVTEFTVEVRNDGGTEDPLRWQLGTIPAGWNATLVAEWLGLQGGAGNRSTLRVRALADPELEPGHTATLLLSGTSFNTRATASTNLTLRTEASDFEVRTLTLDRALVYKGEPAEAHMDLRNIGRVGQPKPARMALYAQALDPPGAEERVASRLLSGLGPGVSQPLAFPWDPGNLTGRVRLRAVADADQNIPEVHEDNNEATLEVVVHIPALGATAPGDRSARPGDALDYTASPFTVTNLGNAAEDIRATFTTPRGWVAKTEVLRVPPGATQAFDLSLRVPLLPGTLAEDVELRAELVNHTSTHAVARSRILVVDDEPPVLASLAVPARAALGEAATVRAVLRDAVGVREAQVVVEFPNGTLRNATMRLVGADVWEAQVVFSVPGTMRVWVRAVDATPGNHTLDARDAARRVEVGVETAPLIEMVEPPPSGSVRSGTLLRFRITDVHGVDRVLVEGGGRTVEVGEPYAVSTSGWPPGEQEVRVTAVNNFGKAGNATFIVTIDDTAPLLREPQVRPAKPTPGKAFAVEAKTSLDARLASVRVTRDGRFVQEAPASVGLGLLNATLVLTDAGKYVLVLRAEDAAGNTGSLEVAVEVGSSLPAPGAAPSLAALAAAAGLALLRGRTRDRRR